MNTPERFSLAEAAKHLGVSIPTARRMVFKGGLSAVKVMVGDKARWEIPVHEVFTLQKRSHREQFTCEALSELAQPAILLQDEGFVNASPPSANASVNEGKEATLNRSFQTPDASVPLAAHLAAIELASKQIDRLSDKADRLQLKAEHAERMRFALEHQLQQYQAALSSQAESLAEERAMRLTFEARAKQTELATTELESLKVNMPTATKSWGHRVKRWLGLRTGT